jgi:hypothetical protein
MVIKHDTDNRFREADITTKVALNFRDKPTNCVSIHEVGLRWR